MASPSVTDSGPGCSQTGTKSAGAGPSFRLPRNSAGITILLMTWVHTLLAVWLTLAVPTAGVASASGSPECQDHAALADHGGQGDHQGHGSHPDRGAGGDGACECECGPLHCGFGLSIAASGARPTHLLPSEPVAGSRATGELPAPMPDDLYRPPIPA